MRRLAVVITAVMTGLSAAACAAEADDGAPTTSETTTTTDDPAAEVKLRFAPVLAVFPTACDEVAAGSEVEIDPATLTSGDGECYDLTGDEGLDGGAIVASATAQVSQGMWAVAVELTNDGIDAFNALAASCYARSEPCPTGQLAVVVDEVVVSAPSIQQPSFERDQIQISGSFTESQAKELAGALANSNP